MALNLLFLFFYPDWGVIYWCFFWNQDLILLYLSSRLPSLFFFLFCLYLVQRSVVYWFLCLFGTIIAVILAYLTFSLLFLSLSIFIILFPSLFLICTILALVLANFSLSPFHISYYYSIYVSLFFFCPVLCCGLPVALCFCVTLVPASLTS